MNFMLYSSPNFAVSFFVFAERKNHFNSLVDLGKVFLVSSGKRLYYPKLWTEKIGCLAIGNYPINPAIGWEV